MINKLKVIAGLLLTLLIAAGCRQSDNKPVQKSATVTSLKQTGRLKFVDRNNRVINTINIEIAEDDYSRAMGLMHRTSLPETQGMLFIFPEDQPQFFWMKNTPLSLDMIFANSTGKIVHIEKYTTPFSTQTYPSVEPAKYVVEVVAGFCDRYEIQPGHLIRWRRASSGKK